MDKLNQIHSRVEIIEESLRGSRARNTFWWAVILLILTIISIVFFIFQGLQFRVWQIYVEIGISVFVAGIAVVTIYLSRRDRPELAAGLLIAGAALVILSGSLVIAKIGLVLGIVSVVIFLTIAIQILPQRWINWATLIGVAIGVASGLFELYTPVRQITIPELSQYLPTIIVGIIIIMGLMLAWQFRSMPLASKLIVVFLIITLIVTGVITFPILTQTRSNLTENVGTSLHGLAVSDAQAVGDLVGRQVDSLSALSVGETIRKELKDTNSAYRGTLTIIQSEINKLDQQWITSIAMGNLDDPLIYFTLANPAALDLKEYLKLFPDNAEVVLTDVYGALVAASSAPKDYYLGDEIWWEKSYSQGRGNIYISVPEYVETLGKYSVVIAVPVRDPKDGLVIGILRTNYSLLRFDRILSVSRLGETGEPDIIFVGQPSKIIHGGQFSDADLTLVNELQATEKQNYSQMTYQGISSLVSTAPVRSSNNNPAINSLGWMVTFHQDLNEALGVVNRQTQALELLVVVIVGIVSGIAILIALLLTAPIMRLTGVATRVREGDLSAIAKVESRDEIGRLATAFNAMTTQLRQVLGGLEQRINERTRELSLAGEVGRAVSQMRDLDKLLSNAVELIQFSFDLYYTQVYLTDPGERTLVLRAGAGSVGVELLRRRHRLPIGPGSINGSAASEKRPVIVSDTVDNPTFRPNPLLPDTRSEMAVPLLIGERVVGVLDLQSSRPSTFSDENLPAFEALAGQLAIAIENAELITQTQQARDEVEKQARRRIRTEWQDFLDAVEHSEQIGYDYSQNVLTTIQEPVGQENQSDHQLSTQILVAGEPIGTIQLERETPHEWAPSDKQLLTVVAGQVSRQIENLRLLIQTERYRAEAEDAARRLTREGWGRYMDTVKVNELGYAYDQMEVTPITKELAENEPETLKYPLKVHDEEIGEISVQELELDAPAHELINTVAERLSTHIENLRLALESARLFEQTQAALGETQMLYNIIAEMNAAGSYDDILTALSKQTVLGQADQLLIMAVFDHPMDRSHIPEWIYPVAYKAGFEIQVARRYPLSAFEVSPRTLFTEKSTIIGNLVTDQRLDRVTRTLFHEVFQAESSIVIPLMLGDQLIGFVQGYFSQSTDFPEAEVQRLSAVASQAAIAVQSRLLLEQAQARARQEQRIREVSAQVFSASDVDSIMRRVVEQVSHALGLPAFVYLGGDGPKSEE